MLLEVFGRNIKEARKKTNYSQLDLSSLTGIERGQLSKMEAGKINVTLGTIEKIAEALKVEPCSLLTMSKTDNAEKLRPFVKWAGGKSQLLEKLDKYLPSTFNDYYEPFVGGGALFFHIMPSKAFINDMNFELVCVYNCFKNENDYTSLIKKLIEHQEKHCETYYYQIRELDKTEDFSNLSVVDRAARMVYLNKACFNGLYRVNKKGYFNVPSGKKKEVNLVDLNNYSKIRDYFSNAKIIVTNNDFEQSVNSAKKNDFVYFDPPYDILENKESFTSYSKEDFNRDSQIRLAEVFKKLTYRGVKVMLSNHNTQFIKSLYNEFNIHVVDARRNINAKGDGRGLIEEVIITNY